MALVTLSQDLSVYWLALDPSLELRVVLEARSSAVDLIHVPHRHLAPLFDNPKLDKELRAMLREKFPEFCSSPSPPVEGREPSHPIACFKRGMEKRGLPDRKPCGGVLPVRLSTS